jgi:DNA-binding SARP family transcriptional activator
VYSGTNETGTRTTFSSTNFKPINVRVRSWWGCRGNVFHRPDTPPSETPPWLSRILAAASSAKPGVPAAPIRHDVVVQHPEFGVLGTVAGPVPVPAAKPRALLAAFLLAPNQTCSLDWLIRVLWGDDVPASASNLVSGYVGDLRRGVAAGHIRTVPGGYVFDVDPRRIDVCLFTERVRQGKALLAVDDLVAARCELTAALELWRGPAPTDVESRLLHETEVPRLTGCRRDAEYLRADLSLRLGEHETELPRLAALVAEFPLAEDLRLLQLLALHGAGRRGEALAAYDQAREVLSVELGVEPGAALRNFVRVVRNDDAPAVTPCELPPDLADFHRPHAGPAPPGGTDRPTGSRPHRGGGLRATGGRQDHARGPLGPPTVESFPPTDAFTWTFVASTRTTRWHLVRRWPYCCEGWAFPAPTSPLDWTNAASGTNSCWPASEY